MSSTKNSGPVDILQRGIVQMIEADLKKEDPIIALAATCAALADADNRKEVRYQIQNYINYHTAWKRQTRRLSERIEFALERESDGLKILTLLEGIANSITLPASTRSEALRLAEECRRTIQNTQHL